MEATYSHGGKEVDMNVDIPGMLHCALPDGCHNKAPLQKTQMTDLGKASQALFDKVDIASFPLTADNHVFGYYKKNATYEEDWRVFMADTKMAFEGQNGSKVFVDFSYQTVTRRVRYEVIESIEGHEGIDRPERQGHPLGSYFGPHATADRILGFARGLVHKFIAMEGHDKEKLAAYINKLLQAIEEGFSGMHKVTKGIPYHITGMVRETYDHVMNGMDTLQNALLGTKEAGVTKLTYEENITYTSASIAISVVA